MSGILSRRPQLPECRCHQAIYNRPAHLRKRVPTSLHPPLPLPACSRHKKSSVSTLMSSSTPGRPASRDSHRACTSNSGELSTLSWFGFGGAKSRSCDSFSAVGPPGAAKLCTHNTPGRLMSCTLSAESGWTEDTCEISILTQIYIQNNPENVKLGTKRRAQTL